MTIKATTKKQASKGLELARILVWARKGGGNRMNVKAEDRIEQRLRAICAKIETEVGYDPWNQIMDRAREMGGTMPIPGRHF